MDIGQTGFTSISANRLSCEYAVVARTNACCFLQRFNAVDGYMITKKRFSKLLLSGLLSATTFAFVSTSFAAQFIVSNIRVNGLSRIPTSTFYNYLHVKKGEAFSSEQSAEVIRDLYNTGFFSS